MGHRSARFPPTDIVIVTLAALLLSALWACMVLARALADSAEPVASPSSCCSCPTTTEGDAAP